MIVAAGMSRSSLLVAWMRCATSFSPSNACGQPDAAGGSPQSRPTPAAGDAPLGVSALIEALHAGRARSAPRGDWYERDLALILTALLAGLRSEELRRADVGHVRTLPPGRSSTCASRAIKDHTVLVEAGLLSDFRETYPMFRAQQARRSVVREATDYAGDYLTLQMVPSIEHRGGAA